MAASEGFLLCFLLWIVTLTAGREFTVTCVNSEECVLPCHFDSDGKGARIMWYKKKAVVSCTRYGNTDFVIGHNSPSDLYLGRTGLYADQVLQGNATLLLRDVTPHDQGKYFCITMTAPRTDESSVISLVIKAPVRDVDMGLTADNLTCGARGIYPAPTLTWSTDPPTKLQGLQNSTRTQKNLQGFYDIHSSLRIMGKDTANLTYICSVSSDASKRTAILKRQASILALPGGGVMIPCSFPHSVVRSFNLTWRFGRAQTVLSLNVTSRSPLLKVWEQWKDHVPDGHRASGGLRLQNLLLRHQGSYTCEVSTAEETYITQTDVVFPGDGQDLTHVYVAVICVLIYLLLLSYGTLAILGFKFRRVDRARIQAERRNAELVNLSQADGGVEIQQ